MTRSAAGASRVRGTDRTVTASVPVMVASGRGKPQKTQLNEQIPLFNESSRPLRTASGGGHAAEHEPAAGAIQAATVL